MKLNSKVSLTLLLLFVSTVTLLPFLGLTDYHTKGEPREAIVAVSMLQSDNWILPTNNGGDIAYKPPLFHWAIALFSLPAGEVTAFTSRLPSALAAIVIAICSFRFYFRKNHNTAFLAALLFLSCFEVHRAAMACRVDMVLTLFVVTALFCLYRWAEKGMKGVPVFASLLMGAATLTKGPVGIVLPCAATAVYLLVRGKKLGAILYKLGCTALLSCLLPGVWYALAYRQGGAEFVDLVMEENLGRFLGKMSYESHEEPVFYYIYTTLGGFIPWSLPVLFSLLTFSFSRPRKRVAEYWKAWKAHLSGMEGIRLFSLLSFAVIFIFYCIPKSKRTVYLLPVYPFLCYFLAEYVFWLLKNRPQVWRIFTLFLSLLTGVLLVVFAGLQSRWITPELFPERLVEKSGYYIAALNGPWNLAGLLCVLVVVYLLYQIRKSRKGMDCNNRYIYTTVALFFGVQLLLDALILPDILNAKSMRPFAESVKDEIPEGKIYSYVSTPMMRFFVVNFYTGNRVVNFETEQPTSGYLLVGQNDFNHILAQYGQVFSFEEVMKTDRKGNDVKDIVYLYRFEKKMLP